MSVMFEMSPTEVEILLLAIENFFVSLHSPLLLLIRR
jgi:hypothetical protein